MRFAIWNLDLALRDFAFFEHSYLCKNRLLKEHLTVYFRDSGKGNFDIRDPLFFPFVNGSFVLS